ncbi:MAG: MoaD/ThiS family protein [Sphingomonas bacterium]|nr:MoaD/ThiS family protein [Sphingomonas bacterium]
MRLTFFGRLRDAVGSGEVECSVPATIVDSESLRAWIGQQYPALLDPSVRIALDDVLVIGPAPIAGVAEAGFLPPVSGG